MARPAVGAVTERVYATLPEVYRDADAAMVRPDFPLLRYLAVLLDQLGAVEDLLARLDFDPAPAVDRIGHFGDGTYGSGLYDRSPAPPRSGHYGDAAYDFGDGTYGNGAASAMLADLVDPNRADARWLPWLAQLLGVPITGLTTNQARTALTNPAQAWRHGTTAQLTAAAATALTGTQTIEVTNHYGGNPFVIGLGTLVEETPTADTFGELEAYAPTWGDLRRLGSFGNARAPLAVAAAEAERPAGFLVQHHYIDTGGAPSDPGVE